MVHHRPHKLEIRQGSITKLMVSSATDQVWARKWQKCVPSCQFITLRREVVRFLVFCRQFLLYVRCGCDFSNSVKPQFFTFWRQNRSSAVKPYHRAFNLTSWYVKGEAKRTRNSKNSGLRTFPIRNLASIFDEFGSPSFLSKLWYLFL